MHITNTKGITIPPVKPVQSCALASFVPHDTPNSVEKKTPNNLETHNKTKVAWPNICAHNPRGEGSLGCSLQLKKSIPLQTLRVFTGTRRVSKTR